MASMDAYAVYIAIVESGNLTAAARRLGRSLQAVSRILAGLEEELGAQLIARTTRQCRPTPAGERFYTRIKAAVADVELARSEAAGSGAEVGGSLRIGASNQFGVMHVVPMLAAFMERYPAVQVELLLDDRLVDPLAEGLDLMLRFGEPADSSLRHRKLGSARRVICGAPGYFARHGHPRRPQDLRRHQCIVRSGVRAADTWRFEAKRGPITVKVNGRFRADSAAACCEAAVRGLGIARAPLYQIRSLLDQGRLELVLEDAPQAPLPIHVLWPVTAALPARTRALVDFLVARMGVEGI